MNHPHQHAIARAEVAVVVVHRVKVDNQKLGRLFSSERNCECRNSIRMNNRWFDEFAQCFWVKSLQRNFFPIKSLVYMLRYQMKFSDCGFSLCLFIFCLFFIKAQCQDSQCHCNIDDSPPPHSALSQQSCHDGGNGNGGPGIMNDEYSRRQSIDRLDSPQVICKSKMYRMNWNFFWQTKPKWNSCLNE